MSKTIDDSNPSPEADLPLQVVDRSTSEPNSGSSPKKRMPLVFVTGLAALLALGALAFAKKKPATELPTSLTEPEQARAFALGRLEPRGEILEIGAPSGTSDARLRELKVAENDSVEKGAILAVLDNEVRLSAAVTVAEKTLSQATARQRLTEIDVSTTRSRLEAVLASARSSLETAKVKEVRLRQLLRSSSVSRDSVDDAALTVKTAEASLQQAIANLERYADVDGKEPIDIMVSREDVEVARASLEEAKARWADAFVTAPVSGTVLRIDLHPGEKVGNASILQMGQISKMMVRTEVYESDISKIRLSQPVRLTAEALPKSLQGTVFQISNLVRRQEIVEADPAANTDARVLEVWATIQDEDIPLAAEYINLQVLAAFGE